MTSSEFVRRKNIISVTANTSLARTLNTPGSLIDNAGATGAVTVTLPTDTEPGDYFEFYVAAAQNLVVTGGANAVFTLAATTYTAGFSLRSAGTIGNTCRLVCTGLNAYRVDFVVGTWTVS